jgi:hypothetical protein
MAQFAGEQRPARWARACSNSGQHREHFSLLAARALRSTKTIEGGLLASTPGTSSSIIATHDMALTRDSRREWKVMLGVPKGQLCHDNSRRPTRLAHPYGFWSLE